MYTAKDYGAAAVSEAFEAEAEILWRVERRADTLPALAGLNLLFLATGLHGKAAIGNTYMDDIIQMARRIRLFDVADRLTAADLESFVDTKQRGTAQTAWAAYNYLW